MRQFDNPHNISKTIAVLRVRNLDVLAEVRVYIVTRLDQSTTSYIDVESNLSDAQLESLFNSAETQAEQDAIANYQNSASNFDALPNWATWTPSEAENYVNTEILNGMTRAEVEAYIDANITGTTVTTLREQVKVAFKLVAGELIDLRLIAGKMAYSIMLLRDVAIRRRIG